MGLTNFPNGITSFGAPINGEGVPATPGTVYYVDYGNGNDGNKGTDMSKPLKTIATAYGKATTNKDDVIVLMGSSTHALTEMLTVSKNRVHFVGIDGTRRRYGQNAKISLPVTTAATDVAAIKNTGVRNSFTNIKFISNNTKDESLYTVAEGGEYTVYENCEFYKSTDLDVTGAAEVVLNGDSTQFRGCTFGSAADAISGAIIRPCILLTKATVAAGKVCRDVTIEDCSFWRRASNVANRYIYGANATDVERVFHIKNCTFFATKLSAALPAQCVELAAEQTQGFVLIDGCTSINNTKLSTTTGVYIQGVVPTYATSGIAVAA